MKRWLFMPAKFSENNFLTFFIHFPSIIWRLQNIMINNMLRFFVYALSFCIEHIISFALSATHKIKKFRKIKQMKNAVLQFPFSCFSSNPMFLLFLQLSEKGPRPKWTIHKHVSDNFKKWLSVGNSGILSVVVVVRRCL